jgi:copper chaperone CopZ
MRTTVQTLIAACLLLAGASCTNDTDESPPPGDSTSVAMVVLDVAGMDCPGCADRTRATLKALKGVVSAEVTLSPPEALVRYRIGEVTAEQMIGAIKKLGYDAKVKPQ